ncbi:MAG: hypothetical protein EHM21_00095 [Chloroflexi bacterium]|nr:MAG: hypothetical protein EHM21_00095 [Chloroflexota bacterium]
MALTAPQKEAVQFWADIAWNGVRIICGILITAALITFLNGLEARGEKALKEHETVLQRQLEELKDLERSRQEHSAIWQRLAR